MLEFIYFSVCCYFAVILAVVDGAADAWILGRGAIATGSRLRFHAFVCRADRGWRMSKQVAKCHGGS